jgi:hypothetical protein
MTRKPEDLPLADTLVDHGKVREYGRMAVFADFLYCMIK